MGALGLRDRRSDRHAALRIWSSVSPCPAAANGARPGRGGRMSVQWIGAIGVLALFALLFLRLPVWAALIIFGLSGNSMIKGWSAAFVTLGTTPFDVAN